MNLALYADFRLVKTYADMDSRWPEPSAPHNDGPFFPFAVRGAQQPIGRRGRSARGRSVSTSRPWNEVGQVRHDMF